jgi:DNA-binding PadR family transcriptional regulator
VSYQRHFRQRDYRDIRQILKRAGVVVPLLKTLERQGYIRKTQRGNYAEKTPGKSPGD